METRKNTTTEEFEIPEWVINTVGFSLLAIILFLFYYLCFAVTDARDPAMQFEGSFGQYFTLNGFRYFIRHFSLLQAAKGWGFFRVVLHDLTGFVKAPLYLALLLISGYCAIRFVLVALSWIGRYVGGIIALGGLFGLISGIFGGGIMVALTGIGAILLGGLVNGICEGIFCGMTDATEEDLEALDSAFCEAYCDTH